MGRGGTKVGLGGRCGGGPLAMLRSCPGCLWLGNPDNLSLGRLWGWPSFPAGSWGLGPRPELEIGGGVLIYGFGRVDVGLGSI